jgi:hypothetical protein
MLPDELLLDGSNGIYRKQQLTGKQPKQVTV